MKRVLDLLIGVPAAVLTLPFVIVACLIVWFEDRGSPFYLPRRIGQHGKAFVLFKIRSMVVDADKSRVDTTVSGDPRLLQVGHRLRRFKLDELPQFWNVVIGNMSLVGPRPNVTREVELYTNEERRILNVKPGITDLASIVFSNLEERLQGAADPNLSYNQLVRPPKGKLALYYVDNHTTSMDLTLLWLTALAVLDRREAMRHLGKYLASRNAPQDLVDICDPDYQLVPEPPVGALEVVQSRHSRS